MKNNPTFTAAKGIWIAALVLTTVVPGRTSTWYLKPALNLPVLMQQIDLHGIVYSNATYVDKDVKLLGGLGFNFDIGLNLTETISAEIGLGRNYFSAGIDVSGDIFPTIFTWGGFSYSFVDCSLVYHLLPLYIYGGVRYHITPNLVRDLWNNPAGFVDNIIYEDTLGYHGGIGLKLRFEEDEDDDSILKNIFLFFDARMTLVNFTYKKGGRYYEGSFGSVSSIVNGPLFSDWAEINGNNFSFLLGLGYEF